MPASTARRPLFRWLLIRLVMAGYGLLVRPVLFRRSAGQAHEDVLRLVAWADRSAFAQAMAQRIGRLAFARHQVTVGGATLPHPFIVAAGLVKGVGFASEEEALAAARHSLELIPGWRTLPALVGPVEFGSYTCQPQLGNPGVVLWRHRETATSQNRIGLKNPGALAAAAFLARHRSALPPVFGINIAPTPGRSAPEQELQDTESALQAFLGHGLRPAWFTLNLSCPNTGDDPGCRQTEAHARALCRNLIGLLAQASGVPVPLWVKLSPHLADAQYRILMRVFADEGVKAVIATNTLPAPSPDDPAVTGGLGGGALHLHALRVAGHLIAEKRAHGYPVDVIGCGGVKDLGTYRAFARLGVEAVQYWTGMIYKGPLVAADILFRLLR